MSAEGATDVHGSEAGFGRAAQGEGADARVFLSTRLVRELIAADALADAEGDDRPSLASRLLDVIREGLDLPMAGIVDGEPLACLAAHAIPEGARAVLEGRMSGGAGSVPLTRRALDEHRAFLLGRTSRDPLMVVLRDTNPELEAVALVPLHDRDLPIGLLVLGAADDGFVHAAMLRTLTVAFRLLALLLSPIRGGRDPSANASAAESERYLVEIEELETRLAEANEVVRHAREQASSGATALRAELEAARARIAELEATAAGERNESDLRRDVETQCSRLQSELEERERFAAEAAEERDEMRARLEAAEVEAQAMRERMAALEEQHAATLAVEEPEPDEEPGTLELEPTAGSLGDFVAEAAAAVEGEAEGPQEIVLAAAPDEEEDSIETLDLEEPQAPSRAVWHIESNQDVCRAVTDIVQAHGLPIWNGEGEMPRARGSILVANLLDPALAADPSVLEPAPDRSLWLYGWEPENGLGFEIGAACCLPRPVDPKVILARIQTYVAKKLTGVVLVSAHLRELSSVRAALSEVDAAGSVACDARQALDLLDIVRRPDAILIDLSLEAGQGLALAHQLRRNPDTSDVAILFLLPAESDLSGVRPGVERAGILGPYGPADVRRLVTGALSTHR
jgi:CheY-like chemotaxis protein